MGCGLMNRTNREGIGWFKLELVTYPQNTCFFDVSLIDTTESHAVIDRAEKKEMYIMNENQQNTKLKKENIMQASIQKSNGMDVCIKNISDISSEIKKTEEITI